MKKALSIVLSVLMVFSMVGVMAFAADENGAVESNPDKVTYIFLDDDGSIITEFYAVVGEDVTKFIPDEPVKEDTKDTRYIFSHWAKDGEKDVPYYKSTIKNPVAGQEGTTITYTAVYSEKDISGRQSFFNFIESLFERINLLFEYFALIFQW